MLDLKVLNTKNTCSGTYHYQDGGKDYTRDIRGEPEKYQYGNMIYRVCLSAIGGGMYKVEGK